MHVSKMFCNFAPSNKNNNSKTFRIMAKMTKKEMMDEMIFIYQGFSTGRKVAQQTREKLHKYSAQRNRDQVERCYDAVMSARNAKDANAGIFCCTGIALKY